MRQGQFNSIDQEAVKPSLEIGAFEALWASEISSFKQLREKLQASHSDLMSRLIDLKISEQFYKRTLELLQKKGINHFGVRIDGTIDYPERLHDADHPVTMLYYQGNWDLVYGKNVAVVGTRNPSDAGLKRTKRLVRELVLEGYTIFSGLASGIDTAAHTAAIESNGKTVAVIGTPLCLRYSRLNIQ